MSRPTERRRLALVLAGTRAVPPPGIGAAAFAEACLADSYEVLADLEQVRAGIAFPAGSGALEDSQVDPVAIAELLWPDDLAVPARGGGLRAVADAVPHPTAGAGFSELLVVPADVPDLPGLVLAKVAKALHRADVCTAPEVGGEGLSAIGVRLPWPEWLSIDLDFDRDPHHELLELAPERNRVARVPGWHRLRYPTAVDRLDPRLEGWEQVRLLLGGWC